MVQICHLDTGWYDGDPGMTSDLWELRAWLTLKEAAGYLYFKVGLDVDESNILRLALDGKLQLSLKFLKPMEAIQYREGAELEEHRTGRRLKGSGISSCKAVFALNQLPPAKRVV